jgi:hypothetical protein
LFICFHKKKTYEVTPLQPNLQWAKGEENLYVAFCKQQCREAGYSGGIPPDNYKTGAAEFFIRPTAKAPSRKNM